MKERMFGLETEYAITWIKGRKSPDREHLTHHFMEAAKKCLVHLPDLQSSGMFLENGSRLYIDCGQHPEFATPECTNPWDAVRYLKAGEWIINSIIKQLRSDLKTGAEIFCSLCNVDYLQNTTWGCHESYLHQCDVRLLASHLIPHLVSRTVFTGAGGFRPSAPGLRFTLSPRASYISHIVSSDSTGDRGIYHTKDESLSSGGYHRLHILCGESLRSETAIFLKVATTAIIVAMIEAGIKPCNGMQLASPVDALHTVAADTNCREKLELAGGRTASALEIQRNYLKLAELHQNDSFMPPWTAEVCSRWRKILDLLEENPGKTNRILDWSIKQALYSHHLEKRGVGWEKISAWSKIVDELQSALNERGRHSLLRPDLVFGPNSPVLETVARLTPRVRENGLRWDWMEDFLRLKQEMFEIDARFGQLDDESVFRSLDRAGLLEHHIDGVNDIEQAAAHAPIGGRAQIRGEMIRRLAGQSGKYRCSWQVICDEEKVPVLDLSDPFAGRENGESSARHENQRELPFADDDGVDPLLSPFLRVGGPSLGAR